MQNSSQDFFINLNKVLSEYDLQINGIIPANLKCMRCNKVLVNACHTPCGCRYCHACVDEMSLKGPDVCPGGTSNCNKETLSHYQIDYSRNKDIRNLVLKCPRELCFYRCKLVDLFPHLIVCQKKCQNRFCNTKVLYDNDNLGPHKSINKLQMNNKNNTKNLKDTEEDEETHRFEMNALENELERFQENISTIIPEMNTLSCQQMRDIVVKQMQCLEQNFIDKIEKEAEEIVQVCNRVIEKKMYEKDQYKIELINEIEETKRTLTEYIEGTRFIWNISQLENTIRHIDSEFFFSTLHAYKMKLSLWNMNNEYGICLIVYSSSNDTDIKWPFEADVTIKITNQNVLGVCKHIFTHCKIDRSKDFIYQCSEVFTFSKSDVVGYFETQNECVRVELFIDVK